MFERDKDDLRALGIPIETLGDHADPNDLREARYRIPKAEYDLPVDIEFTSAELAVLRLAGSVWSEESLSGDAQAGVRKIRALGIDVDEPIIGFAPRITARDAAFAPLQGAIERGVAVAFDYLKPGEEAPRRRRVRPFALVEYEARWHVFGRDIDADGDRMFLLTRIVGDVAVTSEAFPAELREGAGERALASLEAVASAHSALLEVTPGTERRCVSAGAPTPRCRGSGCPMSTCTSSPTSSPRTARRSASSSRRAPRRGARPAPLPAAERARAATAREERCLMAVRKPLLTSDRVRAYLTLVPYLLERGEVTRWRKPLPSST